MASFDIVSEINMQEVDNALNQVQKELNTRFDFKGAKITFELDKPKFEIKLSADSDMRLDALQDIISSKLIKRGIDLGALDISKPEQAGGMMLRQTIKLKQGIEQPLAKDIIKTIKGLKVKVDAAIQDKQVRVTGKKLDDLQEVISALRSKAGELKVPLQFVNMRS